MQNSPGFGSYSLVIGNEKVEGHDAVTTISIFTSEKEAAASSAAAEQWAKDNAAYFTVQKLSEEDGQATAYSTLSAASK